MLAAAGATSTMAQATSTGLGLCLRLCFVDIMWTLLLQIVDVSGCSQQWLASIQPATQRLSPKYVPQYDYIDLLSFFQQLHMWWKAKITLTCVISWRYSLYCKHKINLTHLIITEYLILLPVGSRSFFRDVTGMTIEYWSSSSSCCCCWFLLMTRTRRVPSQV